MSETTISVVSSKALLVLFGACDQHLRQIRESLGVTVFARDGRIHVEGDENAVLRATEVLEVLQTQANRHGALASDDVTRALAEVEAGGAHSPVPPIDVYTSRQIRPRTSGQAKYVTAMRESDLTFSAGPAGTGKTYLAVAMAVAWLKAGRIGKIVLVRPAVEAGESLGYLPGDMQAKINPYLRPLLDALREMMEPEMIRRYTEEDLIEVVPLAYMRGRTLNQAFIILDEGQNTTVSQMRMFLTRMGHGSKIVVCGDTTQIDLPPQTRSGMIDGLVRLRGIKGFTAVELTRADIVRHPLVQAIVDAYERSPKRNKRR